MHAVNNPLPIIRRVHLLGFSLVVAAGALLTLIGPLSASSSTSTAVPVNDIRAPVEDLEPPEPEPFDPARAREEAEALLHASFEHIEPEVRRAVLAFVRMAHDPAWEARLLERLESEPDPEVRAFMAVTLGMLGSADARPRIQALYQAESESGLIDADPELAVFYDHALALLGDTTAARRLYENAAADDASLALNSGLILADLSRPGDSKAIRRLQDLAKREITFAPHHPHAGLAILASLAQLGHKGARRELHKHTESDDESVRLDAATRLADMGDDAGRDALLHIFNNGASKLRIPAAVALVRLGEYAGASLLTDCVNDKRSPHRAACARALSVVGDMDLVLDLQELYGERDRVVSVSAATAVLFILGLQPGVLARESIDWVQVALRSEDWTMRRDATLVTASLPADIAVPLLAQAVVDDHAEVRKSATDALARMKTEDAARTVVAALEAESDMGVKERQVIALAHIGNPVAADTLATIARGHDRLGTLATGAHIAVLDQASDAAIIDQALDKLNNAYQRGRRIIRLSVMESAVLADNARVVPTLELGLADRVDEIRLAAAEGLAHYRATSERVITFLRSVAGDAPASPLDSAPDQTPDQSVEFALRATVALIELGAEKQPRLALASALEHPSSDIRRTAVPTIANVPWSDAHSLLTLVLADREPVVRHVAIDTLDAFADEHPQEAVHLLKAVLRDATPPIRARAKARLAALLPRDTVPPVTESDGTPDTSDLESALERVRDAHRTFQETQRLVDEAVSEIEQRTATNARDDNEVDAVEALGQSLDAVRKALIADHGRIGMAVFAVEREARALPSGVSGVDRAIAEAKGMHKESGQAMETASHAAENARERVATYLEKERRVDKDLCIQAAETSIASGRLSVARRDLECAERVYRGRSDYNPRLHYAWGYYYDERAQKTQNQRGRTRNLSKARERYNRFVEQGQGYLVDRVKERLVELDKDLTAAAPGEE